MSICHRHILQTVKRLRLPLSSKQTSIVVSLPWVFEKYLREDKYGPMLGVWPLTYGQWEHGRSLCFKEKTIVLSFLLQVLRQQRRVLSFTIHWDQRINLETHYNCKEFWKVLRQECCMHLCLTANPQLADKVHQL